MGRHPQSDQTAINLSEVLSEQGSDLQGIVERARFLLRLQDMIAAAVDPELATRFQVANVRPGRLILLTPSAAWATRLRLHTSQILVVLRRAGLPDLSDIEVRVAPLTRQPVPVRTARPLSPTARQALELMGRLSTEKED